MPLLTTESFKSLPEHTKTNVLSKLFGKLPNDWVHPISNVRMDQDSKEKLFRKLFPQLMNQSLEEVQSIYSTQKEGYYSQENPSHYRWTLHYSQEKHPEIWNNQLFLAWAIFDIYREEPLNHMIDVFTLPDLHEEMVVNKPPINMNKGSFYSKDKDSQRYLLSLYANEIDGCKFAYLDSPDLAATRYFIDRCPNVHLFPINMQANSKEVTEFAKSTRELSRENRVTPLRGDIVSVLYTGSQRFNIIWLDWCDTYKTVASFNDFVRTAYAFEPENCVLAVTLSTHGIKDTIEGSVAIPGQKVLRWLHFLLNGSTGMGFRIKTSCVYPGLDRMDDAETATRMVFLLATLSHKKDLKLPNPQRALDYGARIGKELLIPIENVWPGHNANDPSFRKFLTIHNHLIARVYNSNPASYPFR